MYRRLPLILGLVGAVLLFYNSFIAILAGCVRNPYCGPEANALPGLFILLTFTTILGAFISASGNRTARAVGGVLLLATGSFGLYLRLTISRNLPASYAIQGMLFDGSILILTAGLIVAIPETAKLVFPRRKPISEPVTLETATGELSRVSTAKLILLGLSVIGIASETRLVLLGLRSSLQPAWLYSLVGTLLAIAGTIVVQGRDFKREAIGSLLLAVGATILVVSNLGGLVPYLRGGLGTIVGAIAGNVLISGGGLIMAAAAIAVVRLVLRVKRVNN